MVNAYLSGGRKALNVKCSAAGFQCIFEHLRETLQCAVSLLSPSPTPHPRLVSLKNTPVNQTFLVTWWKSMLPLEHTAPASCECSKYTSEGQKGKKALDCWCLGTCWSLSLMRSLWNLLSSTFWINQMRFIHLKRERKHMVCTHILNSVFKKFNLKLWHFPLLRNNYHYMQNLKNSWDTNFRCIPVMVKSKWFAIHWKWSFKKGNSPREFRCMFFCGWVFCLFFVRE